jgi:PA-IL-like protein
MTHTSSFYSLKCNPLSEVGLVRRRAFRPIVVLLALLASVVVVDTVHAQDASVVVPATTEWMDTGVDVRSGAAFLSITATGSWTNAAGGQMVGPAGYGSLVLPNAVAPDLPFGSLIGRLNGRIFEIGEKLGKRPPDSGRLYLAMNDVPGTYGDNSGQVTVVISQRVNPAIVEFKDPLLAMELLSPDPTPFYIAPAFHWSIKNWVHPPISGYVQVLLDGASASINPVPIVTGLTANAELDGTFTIFTGANPHLDAGQHEVRMQLRDNTASHALLGEVVAYVTAYVPTPAPTIAIQSFKADPDYQNQGSTSKLSWTLQPNGTCLPAALRLTKKDVGKPDVVVMETNSPAAMGNKTEVVVGGSSPLHYTLSVACKFCSTCQVLTTTTVTTQTLLAFAPAPPPAAGILTINGPFFIPIQVIAAQPFTASWTFENDGGAALDAFDVDLFLDGVKEGSSVTVGKLDSHSSVSKSWTITKEVPSGIHTVELKRNGASVSFGQFEVGS